MEEKEIEKVIEYSHRHHSSPESKPTGCERRTLKFRRRKRLFDCNYTNKGRATSTSKFDTSKTEQTSGFQNKLLSSAHLQNGYEKQPLRLYVQKWLLDCNYKNKGRATSTPKRDTNKTRQTTGLHTEHIPAMASAHHQNDYEMQPMKLKGHKRLLGCNYKNKGIATSTPKTYRNKIVQTSGFQNEHIPEIPSVHHQNDNEKQPMKFNGHKRLLVCNYMNKRRVTSTPNSDTNKPEQTIGFHNEHIPAMSSARHQNGYEKNSMKFNGHKRNVSLLTLQSSASSADDNNKDDADDNNKDDDDMDSSLHLRKQRKYTRTEQENIVECLVRHGAYGLVKGTDFWKMMEEDKVCKKRKWLSLKKQFFKKILPDIESFNLSESQIIMFKNLNSNGVRSQCQKESLKRNLFQECTDQQKRNTNYYTEVEDRALLNFIVQSKRYAQSGGVQLWKLMERKQVVAGRSWQSMKERYRKVLIKKLDQYLPSDVVDQIMKAEINGPERRNKRRKPLTGVGILLPRNREPGKTRMAEPETAIRSKNNPNHRTLKCTCCFNSSSTNTSIICTDSTKFSVPSSPTKRECPQQNVRSPKRKLFSQRKSLVEFTPESENEKLTSSSTKMHPRPIRQNTRNGAGVSNSFNGVSALACAQMSQKSKRVTHDVRDVHQENASEKSSELVRENLVELKVASKESTSENNSSSRLNSEAREICYRELQIRLQRCDSSGASSSEFNLSIVSGKGPESELNVPACHSDSAREMLNEKEIPVKVLRTNGIKNTSSEGQEKMCVIETAFDSETEVEKLIDKLESSTCEETQRSTKEILKGECRDKNTLDVEHHHNVNIFGKGREEDICIGKLNKEVSESMNTIFYGVPEKRRKVEKATRRLPDNVTERNKKGKIPNSILQRENMSVKEQKLEVIPKSMFEKDKDRILSHGDVSGEGSKPEIMFDKGRKEGEMPNADIHENMSDKGREEQGESSQGEVNDVANREEMIDNCAQMGKSNCNKAVVTTQQDNEEVEVSLNDHDEEVADEDKDSAVMTNKETQLAGMENDTGGTLGRCENGTEFSNEHFFIEVMSDTYHSSSVSESEKQISSKIQSSAVRTNTKFLSQNWCFEGSEICSCNHDNDIAFGDNGQKILNLTPCISDKCDNDGKPYEMADDVEGKIDEECKEKSNTTNNIHRYKLPTRDPMVNNVKVLDLPEKKKILLSGQNEHVIADAEFAHKEHIDSLHESGKKPASGQTGADVYNMNENGHTMETRCYNESSLTSGRNNPNRKAIQVGEIRDNYMSQPVLASSLTKCGGNTLFQNCKDNEDCLNSTHSADQDKLDDSLSQKERNGVAAADEWCHIVNILQQTDDVSKMMHFKCSASSNSSMSSCEQISENNITAHADKSSSDLSQEKSLIPQQMATTSKAEDVRHFEQAISLKHRKLMSASKHSINRFESSPENSEPSAQQEIGSQGYNQHELSCNLTANSTSVKDSTVTLDHSKASNGMRKKEDEQCSICDRSQNMEPCMEDT